MNGVETKYRHTRGHHNDCPMACDGCPGPAAQISIDPSISPIGCRTTRSPGTQQVRLKRSKQAHTQLGQVIAGLSIQACSSKLVHPSLFITTGHHI